jgi:hypothetical protein
VRDALPLEQSLRVIITSPSARSGRVDHHRRIRSAFNRAIATSLPTTGINGARLPRDDSYLDSPSDIKRVQQEFDGRIWAEKWQRFARNGALVGMRTGVQAARNGNGDAIQECPVMIPPCAVVGWWVGLEIHHLLNCLLHPK